MSEIKINGNKLSYSSYESYLTCGKKYQYEKKYGLKNPKLSSALLFGSALDKAINSVLEAKQKTGEYLPIEEANRLFLENWTHTYDRDNKLIIIRGNTDVDYYASDIVPELARKTLSPSEDTMEPNFELWNSLRHKGLIMIKSYYDNFLPQILEVVEVQKEVQAVNDQGDALRGNIDAILKLQDGITYIIDNKTAARPYEDDIIRKSKQLSIYASLTGINNVGYFVLSKKLEKKVTRTCTKCLGDETSNRVKTCNNKDENDNRCEGELKDTYEFVAPAQTILGSVNTAFSEGLFESIDDVNRAIKADIYPRNYENCYQFNKPCPYAGICHSGLSIDEWRRKHGQ